MWWMMAVSVAMLLNLVLGVYLLWPDPRRWPVVVWGAAMLVTTGWYTDGAHRLASALSSLGGGLQAGTRTGVAAAAGITSTEPTAAPEPAYPRRWEQFPQQADTPVRVEVVGVARGQLVGIDVNARLTNTRADATVNNVRFEVWCFDNFGDLQQNGVRGGHPGFGATDQQTIAPGQQAAGRWTLSFGADHCTRARAWVRSVHFADGSQWQGADSPVVSP